MPTIIRRGGQALLAAAFVALLATILLGGSEGARDSVAASARSGAHASATEQLRILRRASTASDAVPGRWTRMATTNGEVDARALARARRVDFGAASDWVFQSGARLCQMQAVGDAMAFSCSDPKLVVDQGAMTVNTGPGWGLAKDELRVSGIVPDGASKTVLVLADGSETAVAVKDNLFDAVTPRSTRQFRWVDSAGKSHAFDVATPF
jgi:hypothetical protein